MKVLAVHLSPLMYTKIYLRLEPLGLELVSQSLRRAGHEVTLLDLQVERHQDYFRVLDSWNPDVVAFSCNYWANVPEVVDLARATKGRGRGSFICVGGHSASFIYRTRVSSARRRSDRLCHPRRGRGIDPSSPRSTPACSPLGGTGAWRGHSRWGRPPPQSVRALVALRPARDLLRHRRRYFIGVFDPCASIEFTWG